MSAATKQPTNTNGNGEPSEIVGLYAKLAQVVTEIDTVPKNGHNEFHNYHYVEEADLLEAVRLKLADRGVVILPSVTKVERESTLTTVHLRFVIHDSETGEHFESDWAGTGSDKGDKALYKAYTGALKYFLMKTLLIPTGNDPEGGKEPEDPPAPQIDRIDADQAAHLRDLFDKREDIDTKKLQVKLGSLGVTSVRTVNTGLAALTPGQAADLEQWLRGSE